MPIFKRDRTGKGGSPLYAWYNADTGERRNMPSHWRYNQSKHGALADNPFKRGGLFGPGSSSSSVSPIQSGIPSGGAVVPPPPFGGTGGVTPRPLVSSQAEGMLRGLSAARSGLAPIKSEIEALRAGNFGLERGAIQKNMQNALAAQRATISGLGGQGLWGQSGLRDKGIARIQNERTLADREASQEFGQPAVDRLKRQAFSHVGSFVPELMDVLFPGGVSTSLPGVDEIDAGVQSYLKSLGG